MSKYFQLDGRGFNGLHGKGNEIQCVILIRFKSEYQLLILVYKTPNNPHSYTLLTRHTLHSYNVCSVCMCLLHLHGIINNIPFLIPLHAGDDWFQLLVDDPMSRCECHLKLYLTPAQCGQLLSRVNDAKGLEELSLMVCLFPLCVAVISNWLQCYF